MELDRWRGSESEQHDELHEILAPVGKRTLTSRLGAPSLVLRVEDVTVARALGDERLAAGVNVLSPCRSV